MAIFGYWQFADFFFFLLGGGVGGGGREGSLSNLFFVGSIKILSILWVFKTRG